MPRTGTGPDFIEALARGIEVITAFRPGRETLSLTRWPPRPAWPGRPRAGSC